MPTEAFIFHISWPTSFLQTYNSEARLYHNYAISISFRPSFDPATSGDFAVLDADAKKPKRYILGYSKKNFQFCTITYIVFRQHRKLFLPNPVHCDLKVQEFERVLMVQTVVALLEHFVSPFLWMQCWTIVLMNDIIFLLVLILINSSEGTKIVGKIRGSWGC